MKTILQKKIIQSFREAFDKKPEVFIKAPGRINLIGEHTDYNLGWALPAAIDKHVLFGFSKNNTDRHCRILALDFADRMEFSLDDFQKSDKSWANYLLGIIQQFQLKGIELTGFDCAIAGNIPVGAGLSSSAALECGFGRGLSELFESSLPKWELARLGKKAENDFVGLQCGILDQFASLFGKANHAMLLDCRSQEFEYVPLNLGAHCFVLINSNVPHEHTISGYNDRPAECREAVAILQKKYPELQSLRDLTLPMLEYCKPHLPENLFRRCCFILAENLRVQQFCAHLKNADFGKLGALLYQSHLGLQQQYEVSCPELDLLVDLTRPEAGVLGSRMMGGGFGGCTLNLMKKENCQTLTFEIMVQFRMRTGIQLEAYFVRIEKGVHRMPDFL